MDLHDLHSLIAGNPAFSSVSSPGPSVGPHLGFSPAPGSNQYGMLVVAGSAGEIDLAPPPPQQQQNPGMDSFGYFDTAFGSGGQGRWPRQETLILLEVRARLDSKFREAAHKGPLWDEVSRIMAEEHGYSRNGKKCREKLENLYKYYKKTKERKAGRQDGKRYRFFRQLEALYGGNREIPSTTQINQPLLISTGATIPAYREAFAPTKVRGDLISFCSSSEFSESSSSTEEEEGKSWNSSEVEEFISAQIKRFIEVQEAWMDQMLQTLEHMEQVRVSREEDWRRKEAARFDRECSAWAGERAWIASRDAAIMRALEKFSTHRRQLETDAPCPVAIHVGETSGSAANCLLGKAGKRRRKSGKMREQNLQDLCCEQLGSVRAVGLGLCNGASGGSNYGAAVNGVDDESSFLFSVSEEEGLWGNDDRRDRRGES